MTSEKFPDFLDPMPHFPTHATNQYISLLFHKPPPPGVQTSLMKAPQRRRQPATERTKAATDPEMARA